LHLKKTLAYKGKLWLTEVVLLTEIKLQTTKLWNFLIQLELQTDALIYLSPLTGTTSRHIA